MLDEAGGIHVSAETARRVACDAATVTMRHGPGGEILDVSGRPSGRRKRTSPAASSSITRSGAPRTLSSVSARSAGARAR